MRFIVLIVALLVSSAASAAEWTAESQHACEEKNGGAVACFAGRISISPLMCRSSSRSVSNAESCRSSSPAMRMSYEAAKAAAAENAKLLDLVKNTYATWMTAMDSLQPGFDEPTALYEQRANQLEHSVKMAANRLRIEL